MIPLIGMARGRTGGAVAAGLRPQDVFATSLYTGTGASQTINNGLDLSGQGGMVWQKNRSTTQSNTLVDTVRGGSAYLVSDSTAAEAAASILTFRADGFATVGNAQGTSGQTYTAWSFRRAPKFFDIVTYTGDGTSGRQIPHGLGVAPGMIVVKRRDSGGNWRVYHRSLALPEHLVLNLTNSTIDDPGIYGNNSVGVAPSATSFTVGNLADVNVSGATYVAYLFAHDPDTTNGIIQCGSLTESGAVNVNLGWRPQWLLIKSSNSTYGWYIFDTTRGWTSTNMKWFRANTPDAESTDTSGFPYPTATGFTFPSFAGAGTTWIYLAIRAPIT